MNLIDCHDIQHGDHGNSHSFQADLATVIDGHMFELQPSHLTSHRYPTIARGTPILKRTCKDNDQFCRNDEAEKVESPGLSMEIFQ